MVLETFRQALQNVWSNKLRTFLTMLGIIIGVMAVIVIVGLGNGMTRSVRDSFSAMGTNTLSIQIWGYGSRTATVDDLYDIVKKNPELLSSISPQLDFSDNTPKVGTTQYRYGTVYGVDENYIKSKGYTLAKGRNIQYMDITDNKQICVIDSKGASGMLALIVLRAQQLIEAGKDFEEVCAALREYQASLRIAFTLSNFGNLIKAGRMSPFIGSVLTGLGIHVIADATPQGTIHVAGKARGESKTIKHIVHMMAEAKDVTGLPVLIAHCENLAGAMKLKQAILAELPVADVTLLNCKGLCTFYAMEKGLIVSY